MRFAVIATLAFCLHAAPVRADVIYVDPAGTIGYPTIQEGISASAEGDTVIVLAGFYAGPDNRDLDFAGDDIVLRSSDGPDATVIYCEGAHRAFLIHGGETSAATIEGFTIRNGSAECGGGIQITASSLTIRDCSFESCSADEEGGTIALYGDAGPVPTSTLTLDNCFFTGSHAYSAGTIRCSNGRLLLSECEFRFNSATNDGSVYCSESECFASNCIFAENDARGIHLSEVEGAVSGCVFEDNDGGGMTMRFGDVAIRDCMFLGNRGETGGGIGLYACSPLIENCTFRSNYAPYGGGVGGNYSSPTILGCFFLNNTAFYAGQAIYLFNTDISTPEITSCTMFGSRGFTRGEAVLYFEDSYPVVERTSVAFSGVLGVACGGAAVPSISRCIVFGHVEGDSLCGDYHDNLFTDPLWCNVENDDFDVCSNSPSLPEHNPWGVTVGASVVIGCGECVTPVEQESWGSIKALFR